MGRRVGKRKKHTKKPRNERRKRRPRQWLLLKRGWTQLAPPINLDLLKWMFVLEKLSGCGTMKVPINYSVKKSTWAKKLVRGKLRRGCVSTTLLKKCKINWFLLFVISKLRRSLVLKVTVWSSLQQEMTVRR